VKNNLRNRYSLTSEESTGSFHSAMSNRYSLDLDQLHINASSTPGLTDAPMSNTPLPPIAQPSLGSSQEDQIRVQQELYDHAEWQGNMIQSLLDSKAEQEERICKLEGMVNTLNIALNALSGAKPCAKALEPKVNDPTEFSGDKLQLEHFISSCETKFLAQPSLFGGGEPAKVLWASSFLSGVPQSWWQPILKAYYMSRENHTAPP